MKNLDELGRAVAALRKQHGMTQRELAGCAGVGTSTLARFETAGVAEFGTSKLLRLLEALGHELMFTPGKTTFTLDDALAQRQGEVAGAAGNPFGPGQSPTTQRE